jgi:hypothetical protein
MNATVLDLRKNMRGVMAALAWIIHELRRENVKRVQDQRVAAG